MNEAKWDALAERWMAGEQAPANGFAAWCAQAICEADLIRSILPAEVETILEVGCGVGRLTHPLAERFRQVRACDTSRGMIEATQRACGYIGNVSVVHADWIPKLPALDAAVVWGNLYDEDWPEAEANTHLFDLASNHGHVLVQTTRSEIRGYWRHAAEGDDWFLISPHTKDAP